MVGAEVSIIRATIMAFISLTALLVGRAYTARQALVISLLIIILYDPLHLLYDVSLHLSFLATAGIVYTSEIIKTLVQKVSSPTYKEIIATTLSAYIATLPYVLYTFGTISVYALLANLIVLPLVPLMMLLTFFVGVTAPLLHVLGVVFGYATTILGGVIIFVAEAVVGLPFSSIHLLISFTTMCFMYLCIISFFYFLLSRTKNETSGTKNDILVSEIISY
jgi:competence protein ComEC